MPTARRVNVGPPAAAEGHREQRPGDQLVEPGLGAVVGVVGVHERPHHLGGHGQREEPEQHLHGDPRAAPLALGEADQQQREEEVELLLDRQRPEVQERADPDLRGREVVVALEQEPPVRDVQQGRLGVPHQRGPPDGREHHHGDGAGGQHHEERGREQPADAPVVEVREVQPPGVRQLLEQDGGDEEAREDEEEVHPDEAAGEHAHPGVEEHHEIDGQAAHPVQSGPVGPGHIGTLRESGPVHGDLGAVSWQASPRADLRATGPRMRKDAGVPHDDISRGGPTP